MGGSGPEARLICTGNTSELPYRANRYIRRRCGPTKAASPAIMLNSTRAVTRSAPSGVLRRHVTIDAGDRSYPGLRTRMSDSVDSFFSKTPNEIAAECVRIAHQRVRPGLSTSRFAVSGLVDRAIPQQSGQAHLTSIWLQVHTIIRTGFSLKHLERADQLQRGARPSVPRVIARTKSRS